MAADREPPVHLIVKGKPACGTASYKRGSTNWRITTCGRCRRSIHMADAEAKAQLNRRFSG